MQLSDPQARGAICHAKLVRSILGLYYQGRVNGLCPKNYIGWKYSAASHDCARGVNMPHVISQHKSDRDEFEKEALHLGLVLFLAPHVIVHPGSRPIQVL